MSTDETERVDEDMRQPTQTPSCDCNKQCSHTYVHTRPTTGTIIRKNNRRHPTLGLLPPTKLRNEKVGDARIRLGHSCEQ